MLESNRRSPVSSQQGVVLLEVLISILIFSMAVLAIVGLQASMVRNATDAKLRADASYIAQREVGAMWADPDNASAHVTAAPTNISNLLPGGTLTVAQVVTGQYQITVNWQIPGGIAHKHTVIATIAGG
ncbi:MAG: prepilin-type cleavage/methylation domain-containing protein [Zoogloeaceae bacterium]|jgi:type IV pilus assembly protein PilV|nr:prepilin-type cleavage/methylation domain-containing protein [Zoogloeaceae bacterium]